MTTTTTTKKHGLSVLSPLFAICMASGFAAMGTWYMVLPMVMCFVAVVADEIIKAIWESKQ